MPDPNFDYFSHRRVLLLLLEKEGQLPPILTVQVDNTTRENKNSTMFTFFSWLVETGMFEQVYLGFLPVG